MVSEDLYISEEKIDVNYVFKNMTDKDITTTVVFPLPDHIIEDYSREDEKYFLKEDNVKKISPTQFEMRAKKFKPEKDLDIMIIKKWGHY